MVTFKRVRSDAKFPRNLDIFWSIHRDDLSQEEVAAKHGISQQRVSQIVRRMTAQVALAPSDEYDGIPQGAQLQFGVRVVLEQFKKRHANLQLAWEKSMGHVTGASGVKDSLGGAAAGGAAGAETGTTKSRERAGSWYRSQHGDWRIDRQLHDLEKTMVEARMLLYSRKWFGWEEAAKEAAAKEAKKPPRRRRRRAEAADGTDEHGCAGRGPAAPVGDVGGGIEEGAGMVGVGGSCGDLDAASMEGLLLEVARYARALRSSREGAAMDGGVVREVCAELMGCLGEEVEVVSGQFSVVRSEKSESVLASEVIEAAGEAPAEEVAPSAMERAEAAAAAPVVVDAASPGGAGAVGEAAATESAIRNPQPAIAAPPSASAPPSTLLPKRAESEPRRVWMTGPDPLEVLSRDERKMTPEEYERHLEDLRTMSLFGSYPGSCRAPMPLWGPAKKRS